MGKKNKSKSNASAATTAPASSSKPASGNVTPNPEPETDTEAVAGPSSESTSPHHRTELAAAAAGNGSKDDDERAVEAQVVEEGEDDTSDDVGEMSSTADAARSQVVELEADQDETAEEDDQEQEEPASNHRRRSEVDTNGSGNDGGGGTTGSTIDPDERIRELEEELAETRQEKEQLSSQYRTLLSKLTGMRQSLGDKLREDAEELDRREAQINQLTSDLQNTQSTVETLQTELESSAQESSNLHAQLAQLRASSSSSSNDVLALTKELRELRGEIEMIRVEREDWEIEAGREREKREAIEAELRVADRARSQEEQKRRQAEELMSSERTRADNLQEVLAEFQAAKDAELEQATGELEAQLRAAVQQLADVKSRAADAEIRLSDVQGNAARSAKLERELKEKNALIGKLRHESVVTQEHLTEALRRLRRNTSDANVDRRLVTNVLLQFLTTPRADPKRFEMLSILATILSWEDDEREKAGLQRVGAAAGPSSSRSKRKEDGAKTPSARTKEEDDRFNESFSNLFVEFLLKEAAQGERSQPGSSATAATTSTNRPGNASPTGSAVMSPSYATSAFGDSPYAERPPFFGRPRTNSNISNVSGMVPVFGGGMKSPPVPLASFGRKVSSSQISSTIEAGSYSPNGDRS